MWKDGQRKKEKCTLLIKFNVYKTAQTVSRRVFAFVVAPAEDAPH